MSSQLVAVNCVSDDDTLSDAESVEDEPRPLLRSDRLYVVSEPVFQTLPVSAVGDDLAGKEASGGAEIRNRVVDADIRAAKWAWAILAIAHCWLIYFMVHNLG
ncbi:hypothetical protein O8B39_04745 [Agrobacterium rhizogenes]|uniref:hypothetical protein n=1 Tax=Agrobacterium leguminum TaxID=2792015 RepID=UPI0022BF7DBC|nr:hypothetical protein [Rhizobium rhizogenes]